MFGFLHGPRSNKQYRQIYASCCSSLRDEMGFRSLPFVSYEAIFACSMAVDFGLTPAPQTNAVTCCKTRRCHSGLSRGDSPALVASLRFSNSLAMLLAGVKLDDDVMDSRSLLARLGRRLLRDRIRASNEFFADHDSDFIERMRQVLDDHVELEKHRRRVEMDRYSRPTGDAFGLVFGILPQAIARGCGERVDQDQVRLFRKAGQLVGQSLIAFDCAVDYHSDRKRGHYNPLGSSAEVRGAFEFAQRKLVELGWHLSQSSPQECEALAITPSILRHRIATLVTRKRQIATGSRLVHSRSKVTASGRSFFSPVWARQGFCDCDCACDACSGCGEAGSAADCCSSGFHCPCDCCCDSACNTTSSTTKSPGLVDGDPAQSHAAGQTAEVVVALSPYGTVRLAEGAEGASRSTPAREEPAKSDSGMIEVGETVVVVRKEAFGLLVRRKANKLGTPREPLADE